MATSIVVRSGSSRQNELALFRGALVRLESDVVPKSGSKLPLVQQLAEIRSSNFRQFDPAVFGYSIQQLSGNGSCGGRDETPALGGAAQACRRTTALAPARSGQPESCTAHPAPCISDWATVRAGGQLLVLRESSCRFASGVKKRWPRVRHPRGARYRGTTPLSACRS